MFCVNCGEKLTGPFCVECGEKALVTEPGVQEADQPKTYVQQGQPAPAAPFLLPVSYTGAQQSPAGYYVPLSAGPIPYYGVQPVPAQPYGAQKKKSSSPVAAFLITLGGLAAALAIVFTVFTVVGNIKEPVPEPPPAPGLLASQGPNNYVPDNTPWVPSIPIDMTYTYLAEIDDADIAGATEPYTATLTSGHYVAGVDFPVGSYMVYAVEGFGSFRSNDYEGRGYVNQLLGTGPGVPSRYEAQLGEVFFPKGTMVSFDGLTVRLESTGADLKNLARRNNELTETVTLTAGTYMAGVDFSPGIYDVVAASGTGAVTSSNDVAGVSNVMSADPAGSHQIPVYYNVILAEYTTITVEEGVSVRLVPSKGTDYADQN